MEISSIGNESLPARLKVTGRERFTGDRYPASCLHAAVLRSPHPHARILSIDTREALAIPGVSAVLTASDLPGGNPQHPFLPILAEGAVRYRGEAVAVIAAEYLELARWAFRSIKVRYRRLPAVFQMEEALESGGETLFPQGNPGGREHLRLGDPVKALAACTAVSTRTFEIPFNEHAAMEPETVLAVPDEQGVSIYCSHQHAHEVSRAVARATGLRPEQVRVSVEAVGGAFGGKCETVLEALTAVVARATGRPVRLSLSREESFLCTVKRPAFKIRCRTGASADGRLLVHQARILTDLGPYATGALGVMIKALIFAGGPYDIPNLDLEAVGVHTHNCLTGPMRGFGKEHAAFALESQIDILARKLGLDPIEMRMANAFRKGSLTPLGQPFVDDPGLEACLKALQEFRAEQAERAEQAPAEVEAGIGEKTGTEEGTETGRRQGGGRPRTGGWLRGTGVASVCHGITVTGGGTLPSSRAVVALGAGGKLEVEAGLADLGQGVTAVLARLAAEALGQPRDTVIARVGRSDLPDAGRTSGSRQTFLSGNAVLRAAAALKEALLAAAADHLGVHPGDAKLVPGGIRTSTGEEISLARLAELTGRIEGTSRFEAEPPPPARQGELEASRQVLRRGTFEAYTTGAHLAEVEVDPASGRVRVIRVVAAHNVGRIINRTALEGQVEGGVAMGMGLALMEEYRPGETRHLGDYRLPRARQAPVVHVLPIEVNSSKGPFGALPVGELCAVPVAPAIINAIADACGARICSLPATSRRIKDALEALSRTGPGAPGGRGGEDGEGGQDGQGEREAGTTREGPDPPHQPASEQPASLEEETG